MDGRQAFLDQGDSHVFRLAQIHCADKPASFVDSIKFHFNLALHVTTRRELKRFRTIWFAPLVVISCRLWSAYTGKNKRQGYVIARNDDPEKVA